MKLRYYLRGLGIGIFVTAIILTISGHAGNKMTDEQVIARAEKLGMVMDESAVKNDKETVAESAAQLETKTPEPTKTVEATKTPEPTKTVEATKTPEPTKTVEETKTPEPTKAVEETKTPEPTKTVEATKTPEPTKTPEATKTPEPTKTPEKANTASKITLIVKGGDSSVAVARAAQAAGLVSDAAAFDRFLCQNGYDKRICVGTYKIPENASEEEVAKIITGR